MMVSTYFTLDRLLQIPAVVCCILSVYLAARNTIWNFLAGTIMALLYAVIDYHLRIYADMSSQFVFIAFQFYGWYQWRQQANSQARPIGSASSQQFIVLLLVAFIISLLYAYILANYTNSTLLPLDISTTALSYSALWLLAKRYIQTWWLWIIINLESVVLYGLKGLYISAGLYTALTALALFGFIEWRGYYVRHKLLPLQQ